MVQCGRAYIVDTSYVNDLLNMQSLGMSKRFIIFVCCESQKKHAEENTEHILGICKSMIEGKEQVFMVKSGKEKLGDVITSEKRSIH